MDKTENYGGCPDTSGNLISYDDNGNMTSHEDKGIVNIQYNYLDLPGNIKFNATYIIRNTATGENETRNVRTEYIYRADGTKLRKKYTGYASKFKSERATTTDYLDSFQYTINYLGAVSLDFVPTSEGYYDFKKNKYIYSYTDHLGNIRLSYFRNTTSGSAEVLEENNYYAFGMKHDWNNALAANPAYNYQYNGKELQTETGWNDYGARMYMSDIGRWGVIDPLAEQMRRYSPYNYAFNNPVMFIDPDGRKSMIYSAGGIMRWDFDPMTTINGVSWFEDSINYISTARTRFQADAGGGDGSGDALSPGGAFVDSQLFKDVMAYLEEPGFDFSQFDFSGYKNHEEPVSFFGNFEPSVFHNVVKNAQRKYKNTEGDGIFRVYGHGNIGLLQDVKTKIVDADKFDIQMNLKSKNWKNVDKMQNSTLIIYACMSASELNGERSIARLISEKHNRTLVIGFDGYVGYGKEGITNHSIIKGVNNDLKFNDGLGSVVFYMNGWEINRMTYSSFLMLKY